MFEGFQTARATLDGVGIPYWRGGDGPPLLLLHGHPQTRVIWHRVAPALARRFTVIAPDLRGYGEADKPQSDPDHFAYSKRAMARDPLLLMRSLGLAPFAVVGHDRGGRVAHRMAVDHPQDVSRVVVLDIAPTLAMYEATDREFASAYWHWFFLIQPAPLPESLIDAAPLAYLRGVMGNRGARLSPSDPRAWAEYERAIRDPATVHAMCEDYRAAATIDLVHDRADRDAGHRLQQPLLVLWGRRGVIERCFDPIGLWRQVADDVRGRALDSGHYIPEEAPGELLAELDAFL